MRTRLRSTTLAACRRGLVWIRSGSGQPTAGERGALRSKCRTDGLSRRSAFNTWTLSAVSSALPQTTVTRPITRSTAAGSFAEAEVTCWRRAAGRPDRTATTAWTAAGNAAPCCTITASRRAAPARMNASPSPVQDTATRRSAQVPAPISGVSPTRPGGCPRIPPVEVAAASKRYDGRLVLDSDDVLSLETLPASLAIIGGGAIGCEFASMFSDAAVLAAHVKAELESGKAEPSPRPTKPNTNGQKTPRHRSFWRCFLLRHIASQGRTRYHSMSISAEN